MATKPDGSSADQIADDDAVLMTLADRDFIDADDAGRWRSGQFKLPLHVLFVEIFDGVPVEVEILGDIGNSCEATTASDPSGETSGEVGIVGEPVESLAFHGVALTTVNPSNGELEIDATATAIVVAYPANGLIVERTMSDTALSAECFWGRRRSVMTAA